MFKGNNKFILMFVGMFALVVLVQYLLPKPVNWKRTYSFKDKNPFGTYAIHKLLEPTYCKALEINRKTLYNLMEVDSVGPKTLILINEKINLSKTDLNTLYDFIARGNTVFIAANYFSGLLADTFHLNTDSKQNSFYLKPDSLLKTPGVKLRFSAANLKKTTYDYPLLCFDSYFRNYDSTKFMLCSMNEDNKAVLIKTKMKKGKLYLMSMPDVFTNCFVVNHKNRNYCYGILSMITAGGNSILWDEYYKDFNEQKDSFLKLVFDSDALYAAYILMIISIICYMVFDGRRRQRAIPLIVPVKNTTLEFVDVVSHVYFNSQNHKYIAEERVKYFYDSIRKRFNVSTSDINESFFEEIHELSGYEKELIKQLFMYCERLQKAGEVTEYDLIELNRQITNFNNKSLR